MKKLSKNWWVYGVILAVLWILARLIPIGNDKPMGTIVTESTPASQEQESSAPAKAPPASVAPPEPAGAATNTIVKPMNRERGDKNDVLPPVAKVVPSLALIRSEVEKDPHGTPESLKEFAHQMAKRMEPALADERVARDLYPELLQCAAEHADYYLPIRISCAVNGMRLVEKYSQGLGTNRQQYLAQLPGSLRQAVEMQNNIN